MYSDVRTHLKMDRNGDGKKQYTFNNDHGSQGQIHVQKVVACGWAEAVCGWARAVCGRAEAVR